MPNALLKLITEGFIVGAAYLIYQCPCPVMMGCHNKEFLLVWFGVLLLVEVIAHDKQASDYLNALWQPTAFQ